MEKKFFQDYDKIDSSAEAVAFIACAVEKDKSEKEVWEYTAIVFGADTIELLNGRRDLETPYREELALYDATRMVLEYCGGLYISSVDVVYNCEEVLVLDQKGNYLHTDVGFRTLQKVKQIKRRYDIDVRFHRDSLSEADEMKIIGSIRWDTFTHWDIENVKPEDVYLTLAKEYAEVMFRNRELASAVESYVYKALDWKKVITAKRMAAEDPEDPEEPEEDDEPLPFDNGTEEEGKFFYGNGDDDDDEDEDDDDEEDDDDDEDEDDDDEDNEDLPVKKSLLDLVMEKAKSIRKKNMTSFHVLYGYACVCLMDLKEVCDALGAGPEQTEVISFNLNKWRWVFDNDNYQVDPEKIKAIVPYYIEEFEMNPTAREVYRIIDAEVSTQKNGCGSWPDDVKAFYILVKLLGDEKDYLSSMAAMTYLKYSKKIKISSKRTAEAAAAEQMESASLEDIAKKSNELYDVLTEKVYGQDMAVQKFLQGYTNARILGAGKVDKPAATFLFVGPPGVGKTYLASLSAKTLGMPLKIFDMSEYAGEQTSEGLVGFERTYKNAQAGALTSYVEENPISVLLIDEIEKAHTKVQLLFLQILEGARCYDKYLEKYVDFSHTIIIFTTNCGKNLYEDNEESDLSALPEKEVIESLRADEAFPAELCSRFGAGNIVMFNHLESHYLTDIVKSKMNEAIKDIAENYHIGVTYDALLPELFLFHLGAGVDARVASGKSAAMIKDAIVTFAKQEVGVRGHLSVDKISINIDLDKENEAVSSMLGVGEKSSVLVVSDRPEFKLAHPDIRVFHAENEDEAIQVVRQQKIALAVIDLRYKMTGSSAEVSNALGVESAGVSCLDFLREKAPQIPIYVLEQPSYHAEDRKTILSYGVRGFFAEPSDRAACTVFMQKLLGQLHIQKSMKNLGQKGQKVEYKTRYFVDGTYGVIELYDLSLRTVQLEDAELRKKAKKSKVFDFERPTLRFCDIIGAEQAKRDFNHFIQYIQNMDGYILEGAERPRGAILYGPPGTGKTSLAKALAGECNVMFLSTTGAAIRNAANPVQEIKDLFQIAYAKAPAILFIDEIDVIAKERMGYDTGTELLVNTLLTEMEGFDEKDPTKPVFVVAATNYNIERRSGASNEVVIDPALVRRFDNPIYVGLPSREERKKYIQILLEKKKYSDRISEIAVDYVAEHTGGKSLAFLKRAVSNMVNAALDTGAEISDDLLTDVLETQLYGEKRENDEAYRLSVARHEAGHAYVAWKTNRKPKFITIVSRGNFGGYVSYGDGEDIHNLSREDYLNFICQALAGRAAEYVYYGERGINTGASSDLNHATDYAIKMICYLGMGNMGLVSMNPEHILETSKGAEVLEEANKILDEQMERAITFIREAKSCIDKVAEVLMDKSYIQGENIDAIFEESEQPKENASARKAKKQKWYVVIRGRKPGIYVTWKECQAQVTGYSGAVYRSYQSEEEAKEAFQSARIGVKNIRDKKLLYHLVKLSDMEQFLTKGLTPDMQIAGRAYTGFDFHAYAPGVLAEQKEHSKEVYVHVCIAREHAAKLGYQIYIRDAGQKEGQLYDYEEGFAKIDWKRMEQAETEAVNDGDVRCVGDAIVTYADIQHIYVPDDETAGRLEELCKRAGNKTGGNALIHVNKRMFV